MAAGYPSPVLPLALSAGEVQAGFASLFGFWLGGGGVAGAVATLYAPIHARVRRSPATTAETNQKWIEIA